MSGIVCKRIDLWELMLFVIEAIEIDGRGN